MKIIDNKAILLNLKTAEKAEAIVNTIPKARHVAGEGNQIIVNWSHDECMVLRNFKIKNVPSPILKDYGWPGFSKPFDHQRKTASFLTLNKRAFCLSEQGCVDADTEYLSPAGWKRIADFEGGKVAQYVPETGAIEFVAPNEFVKLPCVDMIRIKNKYGLDQLLSPEHRVLLTNAAGSQEVVSAEELFQRHEAKHAGQSATRRKGQIGIAHAQIPAAFGWTGGAGIPMTDEQLRVMVAVIADGHFGKETPRCVVRLKRERKVERMHKLLTEAGISYTYREQNTATAQGFTVFTFNAPRRIKHFDSEFWKATWSQLVTIKDEVIYWDGTKRPGNKGDQFFSASKDSADFVQFAANATGHIARITEDTRYGKTCYTVTIRKDGTALSLHSNTKTMWREPSTDGFKYCFSVPSTFLVFRRNGCVFASGNTGKTPSAIWASDYLLDIGAVKRVLVICPLSIMQAAWQNDLFKFAMHRSVGIAHGDKSKRIDVIKSPVQYVIINFDGVQIVKDEIEKGGFDLIIIDEATALKNANTDRWKVINKLVKPDMWLWAMTGTPAAQSPVDAYGLGKLVCPERMPKYAGAWKDMVMQRITQFKWIPKPSANDIVFKALQPAIRYTKAQCLDLPDILYTSRFVPLTKMQEKYYEALRKQMAIQAAGEQVTAVNAAVNLNKLLQISSGCVYSDDGEVLEFDCSDRVKVLKEVIDESSHKVLVFVPFRHAIEVLQKELSASGYTVDIIHGGVSSSKRNEVFKRFQEQPDPQVLIIQPQAAAHGVTLHAANTVVWWGPITSFETYAQANARVHRAGQKNPCLVVHLEGSPAERRLYAALSSKEDNHFDLMELYKDEVA